MPTIEKRGDVFRVKVRVAGKPPATATFGTYEEAQTWGYVTDQALRIGTGTASTPNLTIWFEKYIKDEAPKWSTGKDKIARLRLMQQDPIAGIPVGALRPEDFERLQERLQARGLKPQTVRHYLQDCSSVWQAALKRWRATNLANPLHAIQMPKVSQGRRNRVDPGLEDRIYQALDRHVNPFYGLYARFLMQTAMRAAEPLGIRTGDIDWDHNVLTVTGKGGKVRAVPLSPAAAALLRRAIELRKTLPAEFAAPGGGFYDLTRFDGDAVWPITYSGFYRAWSRARGESQAWIHDLRRERPTRLMEAGESVAVAQTLTGHSSLNTLQKHYLVVQAAQVAKRLAAVEAGQASAEASASKPPESSKPPG